MKKNILLITFILLISSILTGCINTEPTETAMTEETENVAPAETENMDADAEETAEKVSGEAEIIHLTDETYHDIIDNSTGIVMVDFWAAWCGPCLQLAPILEEISAEEGITLYKLNVDENPNTSYEFKITGIPMVYIYKDGEPVGSQMGAGYKQLYLDLIDEYR